MDKQNKKMGWIRIKCLVLLSTGCIALAYAEQPSDNVSEFKNWIQTNVHGHHHEHEHQFTTPLPSTTPPVEATTVTTTTTTVAPTPTPAGTEVAVAPEVPPPPPPPPKIYVPHPTISFEESQQSMLNSAPPVPIKPDPYSDAAFDVMMHQNMPLTPQQIVKLHQLIDSSQRAAAIPANIPPKPVSTTIMVNLAPGSTPPAIRLAEGYVTSLVFVDSTGTPWTIASFDIGDPKSMNLDWDGKSNVLLIQAKSPYSDSDIVVRLVGMPTPITLELVSGQRVVDYRVDLHIPGIGPNTKDLPLGTPLPNSANQLLLDVLDGVAPPNSRPLIVHGGDCQAWVLGDNLFLRTRLTVLSPGWTGRMVSSDGMIAYQMQLSSSVLVSQYGNPIELKIEGI